jgi:putative tricarboxylic transport membrane protein
VRTAGPGLGPGPRFFPSLVGGALLVVGVLYVVDVLRGGRGDPEHSEDIDETDVRTGPTDWRAVVLVSGVFLGFAALVRPLGWVVAATLLFFGVAVTLGARPWLRVLAVAVVTAFATYLLFARGLGVPLPNGVLSGAL